MTNRQNTMKNILVLAVIPLTGCQPGQMYPNVSYVNELAKEGREQHVAHAKDMTEQHKIMAPEVADKLDKQREQFVAAMEKLRIESEEKRKAILDQQKKTIEGLAGIFARLAGFGKFVDRLEDTVDDTRDTARSAASDASAAAAVASRAEDDARDTRARLDGLDQVTRDKFAAASDSTVAKLEKLKDDGTAFRKELADKLNLTSGEMEKLKGMSTEEILMMLGAATGAAGAGGALGKTGKSRAQPQIDGIMDKLDAITTAAALEIPSPSVDKIVAHGSEKKV